LEIKMKMKNQEFTKEEIEKIEVELEYIKNIAVFQASRIEDKKSINKKLILKRALEIVRHHTFKIEEILDEKK